MTIKQLLDEWPRVKEEISPWPWKRRDTLYGTGIISGEAPVGRAHLNRNHAAKRVCYLMKRLTTDEGAANFSFIASAPQNYDLLVQALEEAVEEISQILDFKSGKNPNYKFHMAKDLLTKWGFQ